jgi:thiosulfate reductase cytochrome b subunit
MTTTTTDSMPAETPVIPVVRKHYWLVRLTHWLNIPILLGMILSGLAIYDISPVYHHSPDAQGNTDYFSGWFYDHFSLGQGILASALRWHWFFAYLFMLNGLLYLIGLIRGGGYKSLLLHREDIKGAITMQVYYVGLPFAKLLHKPWNHPEVHGKYNALQKLAYSSMPVFGLLAVGTGWAIHKPASLGWLAWLFGGYDYARVWHFWIMWVFVAFVIPHVILVAADGWDTFRSMVVGWSDRVPQQPPSSL